MNKLDGQIVRIESSEHMSLIDVKVREDIFSAIVLETPVSASYLKIGERLQLLFKETEVLIAKNLTGLVSLRNRVKSRIKRLQKTQLLTKVVLDYNAAEINAIILTRSAESLALKEGEDVEWLVKTNEISLLPV